MRIKIHAGLGMRKPITIVLLAAVPCVGFCGPSANGDKAAALKKLQQSLVTFFNGGTNYRLSLANENKLLYIEGEITPGIALIAMIKLMRHNTVAGVILDSPGGNLAAGRRLARLIEFYQLNTYSLNGCYSACTIAFIAGKNRYLMTGANLGFHQYSTGSPALDMLMNPKTQQQQEIIFFRKQGVHEDFLNRVFTAKHDDVWRPTIEELTSGHVIHGVISPSSIISPAKQKHAAQLRKVAENNPLFQTIKRHDPGHYSDIIVNAQFQLRHDADAMEISRVMGALIKKSVLKRLSFTSDHALIAFAKNTTLILKSLSKRDPALCVKQLFPQRYGPFNPDRHLTSKQRKKTEKILVDVMEASYPHQKRRISKASAEGVVRRATEVLGDQIKYLNPDKATNKLEYQKACHAFIDFYEHILNNPSPIAGNTLRYIFSD